MRIELFGDEVDAIAIVDALTGETIEQREYAALFPAKAYVTGDEQVERACDGILTELGAAFSTCEQMKSSSKLIDWKRARNTT